MLPSHPSSTAAWRGYISHPLGFAFAAPGELKVEKGTYRSDVAGPHDTLVYRFLDDNIEYKAVVIDMTDKANDAATLLGEAAYIFQDGKKLLMDTYGRVDRQFCDTVGVPVATEPALRFAARLRFRSR